MNHSKKILTVKRPETVILCDCYKWITGEDKLVHKIGFKDREAVTEMIDPETVVRLTCLEREYYNKIFQMNKGELA